MTISVQRLVVTAAVLLTGVASSARAQDEIATVTNVPFAFSAGEKNLPQDRYRLVPLPGHVDVVILKGLRQSVVLMSRIERRNSRNPAPSMTFHRYGDQYFLSEVQLGDGRVLRFSESRAETRAAEYAAAQAAAKARIVVASNSPK